MTTNDTSATDRAPIAMTPSEFLAAWTAEALPLTKIILTETVPLPTDLCAHR